MTKQEWPSIKDVAHELRMVNENVECECDVRLQVYPDGRWIVRSGDASYDTDHHGYWGAASVPGVVNGVVGRFNSRDLAKYLLEQAKEQHACEVSSNHNQ